MERREDSSSSRARPKKIGVLVADAGPAGRFPLALVAPAGAKFEVLSEHGTTHFFVQLLDAETPAVVEGSLCRLLESETPPTQERRISSTKLAPRNKMVSLVEDLRQLLFWVKTESNSTKNLPSLDSLEDLIPKVVVAGIQSAGKSTLLNRLMPSELQNFIRLPTGSGTCTRMPIVIHFFESDTPSLTYSLSGKTTVKKSIKNYSAAEWNQMLQAIENHNKLHTEFRKENRMFLKIGAPGVLPFTYIDTPGTKAGEVTLEEIVATEIASADVILLAHAAQNDWDTCFPLLLAQKRKKEHSGVAVFGIVTKAEVELAPADIKSKLAYLERLGFIPAFVNAGREDAPIPVDKEHEHLTKMYPQMPPNVYLGAQELMKCVAKEYNMILSMRVPDIIGTINSFQAEVQSQLDIIGEKPKRPEDLRSEIHKISLSMSKQQGSVFEGLVNSAIGKLEGCIVPELLDKPLEDGTLREYLNKVKSALVPGTEGIYDVLVLVFKSIAKELVPQVEAKVAEAVEEMRKGIYNLWLAKVQGSAPKRAVVAKFIGPCLEKAASAQQESMSKALTSMIEDKPSSKDPYAHTDYDSAKMIQLAGKIFEDIEFRSDGTRKNTFTHDEVNSLLIRLNQAMVTNKLENVMFYNIQNVSKWYFERIFSNVVVGEMKKLVRHCMDTFMDSVSECVFSLDLKSIPLEPAETQKLRSLLQQTLQQLREISDDLLYGNNL